MADIWSQASGGKVHSGSWDLFGVPLPDLGVTESFGGKTGSQGGSDLVPDNIQNAANSVVSKVTPLNAKGSPVMYPGQVQGQSTTSSTQGTNPNTNTGGGGGGGGDTSSAQQQLNDMNSGKIPWDDNLRARLNKEIEGAGSSAEEAARAAAEARRQAAYRAYEGKKMAAGVAKDAAKGQYDWLVETLGSNKKDLLDEVALNEQTGVAEYERQEVKTKENYDKARKEILSTYRDLSREQEKILRGAGVQNSSRTMEAQLRLNNLLGKDMGAVTTGEADAIAMIGTALATFKEKVALTRNSIETEAKSQMDKAALDYDNQVRVIDANLQLSANEREDAYAAADVQLAQDTAEIQKWAAGLKLQVEMSIAQSESSLDDFIVDMTDSAGLLGADLATKQAATDEFINQISSAVTLDKEGNLTMPNAGGARTKVKNLASIYDPEKIGLAGVGNAATGGQQPTGTVQTVGSRDPLASAIA